MSGRGRRGRWLASRVASLLKEAQEDDRRAWGTLLLSDSPAGAPAPLQLLLTTMPAPSVSEALPVPPTFP